MAALDIMPWVSPLGGTYEVRWGPMSASATFDVGEPVNFLTAGTISEAATAAGWTIADFTTEGTASLEGGIACFGPGTGNINWKTGNEYATNDDIAYWPINQGNLFITSTLYATGDTSTLITPAQTDIGESYQISSDGTTWGLEQTAGAAGTDVQAGVVEVLDSRYEPIRLAGGTGVHLVFRITATTAAA